IGGKLLGLRRRHISRLRPTERARANGPHENERHTRASVVAHLEVAAERSNRESVALAGSQLLRCEPRPFGRQRDSVHATNTSFSSSSSRSRRSPKTAYTLPRPPFWLNGTPSKSSFSMPKLAAMWSLIAASPSSCSGVNACPLFACCASQF